MSRPGLKTAFLFLLLSASCARRTAPILFPQGAPVPFAGYADLFARATAACRGVRTLSAELGVSGRAGGARVRGRVIAGLAQPGSMRLEGMAPFGAPAFVLAATPDTSVLLLPRDRRVLRGARAADLLDAIAGLPLTPDDLRALLTGCVAPDPAPTGGRAYAGGDWHAIDLAPDSTAYIRTIDGSPRIVAARRPPWDVEYGGYGTADGLPHRVRVATAASAPGAGAPAGAADLTIELSQIETNVTLGSEVFDVQVPSGTDPITLEELRRAGPLGVARGGR